jgi:hypothetical protein
MPRRTKRLNVDAETPLEKHILRWINARSADYDTGAAGVLKDLFYGGCQSGMVGHLVYYTDTVKFYKRYQTDIDAVLKDLLDSTGCSIAELFGDKWDSDDPLARDTMNQNLLAWMGFEEGARRLAERAGIDA